MAAFTSGNTDVVSRMGGWLGRVCTVAAWRQRLPYCKCLRCPYTAGAQADVARPVWTHRGLEFAAWAVPRPSSRAGTRPSYKAQGGRTAAVITAAGAVAVINKGSPLDQDPQEEEGTTRRLWAPSSLSFQLLQLLSYPSYLFRTLSSVSDTRSPRPVTLGQLLV